MKTYVTNLIPRIQKFSLKLDELTKLKNQHWICLNELQHYKSVFIFRDNNELLISENGIVDRGKWEYLTNQALLIETKNQTFLFRHGFIDEDILALKLDGNDSYAFFINETKYNKELNNINDVLNFLNNKYVNVKKIKQIIDEDEQREWFNNINVCPGCGFVGVKNLKICPDCGLYIE